MANDKTTLVVRLMLEKDDKILFLQQTKKNGGGYSLVGGKVESTENAGEGLVRESFEEANAVLKKKHLRLVHIYHYKEYRMIVILYKAKKWTGELHSKEKEKFQRVVWFPKNDLPKDISPITKHLVQQYIDGEFFSED